MPPNTPKYTSAAAFIDSYYILIELTEIRHHRLSKIQIHHPSSAGSIKRSMQQMQVILMEEIITCLSKLEVMNLHKVHIPW